MKKYFLLIQVFISILALGQTTGKVSGYVSNPQGERLLGANITIENSYYGTMSDDKGYFALLNIPPGSYDITVHYIGYQTKTITGVLIQPSLTTRVDFVISSEALQYEESIIVEAKRPLIQKDATGKMSVFTQEDIESLPVNNLEEIISMQSNVAVLSNTPNAKSGYNLQGIDDIRLRGGRNNEVALLVDGVKISNPVFGGYGTQIAKGAIRQVAISSGGFSAKYGNALSGVINLTTREPQDKFSGSVKYYSSNPFGLEALTNSQGTAKDKQNFQFNFSSRLPFYKKISMISSIEINTMAGTVLKFDDIVWDDYRTLELSDTTIILPESEEIISRYLEYGILDSAYMGLSSIWDDVSGPDGREINPLDRFKGWKALGWNNSWNFFAKVNWKLNGRIQLRFTELANQRYRQINNFNAWYVYDMQGQNVQLQSTHKEAVILNHTLSAKSFYTLQISKFYSDRKVRVLRDYANQYASELNVFDASNSNIKTPEDYVPYASNDALTDPFEYSFNVLADNRWYSGDVSNTYEYRFDFTSQYHQLHKLEFGLNYTQLDIDYHSYQNVSGLDPYPTLYHYYPQEGAVYIQHKSELDLLILNIGLRMDYLNSGSDFWSNPFDPLGTQIGNSDTLDYNNITPAGEKINISPRIGIAYPLTDKSVLYFNFGHFYQNPNYRDLYRASGDNREISLIQGNIIGNPNLNPEKAVQYELGFQQQIGNDLGIKANLWAKETTNQVGSVVVPAYSDEGRDNPFSYSVFVNNNFGSARGFELSVNYQFKPQSGISIDYTLSEAKVLHASSWDGYWSGDTQDDLPKNETRAPWDQTHVFRASLRYAFRHHEGSQLFSVYPFENMMVILMYYGESGLPYTPSVSGGVITEPYSERWDSSHRVDMKIVKNIKSSIGNMQIYFEVKNLFNRQNIVSGYTLTGSAENPGTSSYYTLSSTYWDSRNNNNYGLARIIYWGVEYAF